MDMHLSQITNRDEQQEENASNHGCDMSEDTKDALRMLQEEEASLAQASAKPEHIPEPDATDAHMHNIAFKLWQQ